MTYRYRIQYPELDCRTSRPLTSLKLADGLAEILFFSLVQFPCVEGRVALDQGPKLSHRLQTYDRKCKGRANIRGELLVHLGLQGVLGSCN